MHEGELLDIAWVLVSAAPGGAGIVAKPYDPSTLVAEVRDIWTHHARA